MKNTVFIQFYSIINSSFSVLNGFSDTYDLCKNKGDFVWMENSGTDGAALPGETAKCSYIEDFPIDTGIAYISCVYLSHFNQVYIWANLFPNVKFIVGGPLIDLNFSSIYIPQNNFSIPFNITLSDKTVEEWFGVKNFSYEWKLVPPKIEKPYDLYFSYSLNNYCYWGKCIYCYQYCGQKNHIDREIFSFDFKNVEYDGKLQVRLTTSSLTPFHILKMIPNLSLTDKIKYYKGFIRCNSEEINLLKTIDPQIIKKFLLTTGVEFPSTKMLKYMKKGATTKGLLQSFHTLRDLGCRFEFGMILGWPNLDKQDIKELELFMQNIPDDMKHSKLLLYKLFCFSGSPIQNYLIKNPDKVYSVGPFELGFYPELDQEQLDLNEEALNIIIKYCKIKNIYCNDRYSNVG